MNESEQVAIAEIPRNLKGIYGRLQEINEVLESPKNSLETLVNGESPVSAESQNKELSTSGSMPTIENFIATVDSIDRNSHKISKYANRLVGN